MFAIGNIMRPSLILKNNIEKVKVALAGSCALNPRVFGSVSRGEDIDGSDLDILIDTKSDTSLLDIIGLQLDLENILGIKVDIVTENSLHKRIKANVLSEAVGL